MKVFIQCEKVVHEIQRYSSPRLYNQTFFALNAVLLENFGIYFAWKNWTCNFCNLILPIFFFIGCVAEIVKKNTKARERGLYTQKFRPLNFKIKNTIPVFTKSWFCWFDCNSSNFLLYSISQSLEVQDTGFQFNLKKKEPLYFRQMYKDKCNKKCNVL